MADYLINYQPGELIKASDANSNNQYLLDKISDNAASLQAYLETQTGILQSNISSVQKTLQNNIDKLNQNLSNKINNLENKKFVNKNLNLGIGTTNLSSYLPNDGKHYLVFLNAWIGYKSGDASLTVKSDVMTTASTILRQDSDAGRWSADCAFVTIPIGSGRTITTAGSADGIALRGYCAI